jgi:uncharacterized damage-inducible protein DinB
MKKIIARLSACLPAFAFILSSQCCGQSLKSEDIRNLLVKEWERAKAYTVGFLNAVPGDKYQFKATDSTRSFAQQMLHLAQSNVFLMSITTDLDPLPFSTADLEHSPTAQKKDSVMNYITTSYDYCIQAIKNFDVNKWGEKKNMFGFEETRLVWLLKTFEHQVHHRGQTVIYIRLMGLKPPSAGMFQ